jgi:hypothetical protein
MARHRTLITYSLPELVSDGRVSSPSLGEGL